MSILGYASLHVLHKSKNCPCAWKASEDMGSGKLKVSSIQEEMELTLKLAQKRVNSTLFDLISRRSSIVVEKARVSG